MVGRNTESYALALGSPTNMDLGKVSFFNMAQGTDALVSTPVPSPPINSCSIRGFRGSL